MENYNAENISLDKCIEHILQKVEDIAKDQGFEGNWKANLDLILNECKK